MKRIFQKGASALLALALAVSPALAVSSFPDVAENAAYAQAVDYVSQAGIMVGDDKGNFAPEKTVTRAEMATILCNVLEENQGLTTDGSVFTDVPAQHWANRYVVKAAELGLVSGYGNGKFGPEDPITREQLAVMLWRYAGSPAGTGSLNSFPDGAKTSDWAVSALKWAVERKIIIGRDNGALDPSGTATRAEVATMLMRYCRAPA